MMRGEASDCSWCGAPIDDATGEYSPAQLERLRALLAEVAAAPIVGMCMGGYSMCGVHLADELLTRIRAALEAKR